MRHYSKNNKNNNSDSRYEGDAIADIVVDEAIDHVTGRRKNIPLKKTIYEQVSWLYEFQ
jgi:hypothetical protein